MKPVCLGGLFEFCRGRRCSKKRNPKVIIRWEKTQSEFPYDVQLHYRQNGGSLTFLSSHHCVVPSSPRRSLLVFFSQVAPSFRFFLSLFIFCLVFQKVVSSCFPTATMSHSHDHLMMMFCIIKCSNTRFLLASSSCIKTKSFLSILTLKFNALLK